MIQIDDKLISEDIFSEEFVCNLSKCKGICCVEGDAGAPLDQNETEILKEIFPKIKNYLRPVGVAAIEEQGTHVVDIDGDLVTTLVNGGECAFVIFDEKEEVEITGEDLAGMDFEELEDVCDDNDLDTDPDDYEEDDVEKFRKAIAKELGITLPKGKKKSAGKKKK